MTSSALAPRVEEIADGVHAYLQPDGGWCLNNAGIIVGSSSTALIDTAATEQRARRLESAVMKLSSRRPDVVVNTHFHGDHTYGNFVFAQDATIVAHEDTRVDMAAAGLHMQGLWPDVGWGAVEVALPTLTIREPSTIYVGGIRAELLTFGPAHTRSDIVVWLPDTRVLFTGDLVMSGVTPFLTMGSLSGSLEAVRRLRELDAAVFVTGHGPVTDASVLDVTEGYLRWAKELAEAGIAAGLSPLEVARDADLGAYAGLLDCERLVGNLHRAYAEAAGAPPGAPLDVNAIFADIIAFHGKLPACQA
ncbi:MAG TPA: MBL fold metallo-hydrolase [Jatrophihabitans sp.]|jgi:cyclase|uniref:MBL fold metallo-hydrolase n=1 Tax=Jatrophihabitans sp. TaxID=1932789 RepID=UPI002EF14553